MGVREPCPPPNSPKFRKFSQNDLFKRNFLCEYIQVSKQVLHIYFVDPNSHDNVDYYQSIHDFGLEYCPKHCLRTAMTRLIANSHSYRCFLARAAEWKTARNSPAVTDETFWPKHTNSFLSFLEQQFVWQHQKVKMTRINHFQRALLAEKIQYSVTTREPAI